MADAREQEAKAAIARNRKAAIAAKRVKKLKTDIRRAERAGDDQKGKGK